MMRLWIFVAALAFSLSAAADNVLMKGNGLGAAAAGIVGLTAGSMALAPPPQWQGYPKGGTGLQFEDDSLGGAISDCATADGTQIAKALKGEPTTEPAREQNGRIRLTESGRQTGTQIFDSKAIYGAGQSPTCPER
jgi:hypothetical protein